MLEIIFEIGYVFSGSFWEFILKNTMNNGKTKHG